MNKHVIDFPKAASLTESVYGRLRADLLSCRLKPGSKLKVSDLCDELGVSLAVVRESLSRLSAEGLVTSEAQKGFRVPPIASRDLADLTKARIAIEQLCLREAVANATVEWETQIMATHHRMSRSPERDPADPERLSDTYAEAHGAFHEAPVKTFGCSACARNCSPSRSVTGGYRCRSRGRCAILRASMALSSRPHSSMTVKG
jgi:DNA-binding GntR family transcriptional regulator